MGGVILILGISTSMFFTTFKDTTDNMHISIYTNFDSRKERQKYSQVNSTCTSLVLLIDLLTKQALLLI